MKQCPNCKQELSNSDRFCPNCGARQPNQPDAPVEKVILDVNEPIEKQFTEQFFLALKERVRLEHDPDHYQAYSERVYESGFRDLIARKTKQVQQQIQELQDKGQFNAIAYNRELVLLFEDMLDYFIIRYCGDLLQTPLPEAILKHQYGKTKKSKLYDLIFDYLDLDNEKERIYTDFLAMPVSKLKNTSKAYLFPARDEKIFFICDTSIFGNGKEGFSMTDRALYWKAPLQKARTVNYQSITEVLKEKDWITINSFFFNVNPSLNLKMLKLLLKIKRWEVVK